MSVHKGDDPPIDLPPGLYDDLKKMARRHLCQRGSSETLGTTVLVHETYLKLINQASSGGAGQSDIRPLAACAMRSVLVDHVRRRRAQKRSADGGRVPLDDVVDAYEERSIDLIALNDALARLTTVDGSLARLVELRFFGGLTVEETSSVLKVSERTVRRDWQLAKAWLRNALGEDFDRE